MSLSMPWTISGSYFEVCNCEAICPCRQYGARKGGRSSYDTCDFAISWRILEGHAGSVDLTELSVVLAGSYSDDKPGTPWRVTLYVDERGKAEQQQALTNIFLGRAGGNDTAQLRTRHWRGGRCASSADCAISRAQPGIHNS